MKIICPECKNVIVVQGLGRKSFTITVINVCDALQLCHSVPAAANELGCSPAYIYKVLKQNNLKAVEVMRGEKL